MHRLFVMSPAECRFFGVFMRGLLVFEVKGSFGAKGVCLGAKDRSTGLRPQNFCMEVRV